MSALAQFVVAPSSQNRDELLFVFGIPLIGSHLTDDFQGICKLLGETLNSCLQQNYEKILILVACNEIPDASWVPPSPKIQFIPTKALSRAELVSNPYADIALKRNTLINAAVDFRAGYYYQFDADDLISSNLVSFVMKSAPKNGCLLGSGYLLDSRTNSLYHLPNSLFRSTKFYRWCGGANIVSLDPTPDEATKQSNTIYLKQILSPGHHIADKTYENVGRPAQELDFPACIYRANHGSNYYLTLNRAERMNDIDAIASNCAPVAGDELEDVKKEFGFRG